MKKIILCSCLSIFGFAAHSYAQQNPVIEKAIKDQNRKDNEAKADVIVADSSKKVIHQKENMSSDSTAIKKRTSTTKKKYCAAKRNKKSS